MTAKQRDLLISWSDFYYGRGACSSRARAISHFAFICDYIVQNVGGLRRRTASILHHSCLLCCRFLRLRARGNALGARGDCSAAQNETHICYCSGNVLSVLRATTAYTMQERCMALSCVVDRLLLLLYAPPFAVHFESSICPLQFSCALVRFLHARRLVLLCTNRCRLVVCFTSCRNKTIFNCVSQHIQAFATLLLAQIVLNKGIILG